MVATDVRLIDQLPILHAPKALLRQVFERGEAAVAERGIRLRLHEDMASLRDRHREFPAMAEDRPLPSQLDVAYCALPTGRAFWIEGTDAGGRTVLTHACRLFDWPETDLEAEGLALRIFYDDPHRHGRPGVDLTLASPMPVRVTGRVAYIGGLWVDPALRRRGLAGIVPRIGRAAAHARWAPDFGFSHVVDSLLDVGLGAVYGYRNRHRGLRFRNRYGKAYDVSWVWMSSSELVSDLSGWVGSVQSNRPRSTLTPETIMRPVSVRQGSSSRS